MSKVIDDEKLLICPRIIFRKRQKSFSNAMFDHAMLGDAQCFTHRDFKATSEFVVGQRGDHTLFSYDNTLEFFS
ncbi:MAG: hypothetical protein MSG64_19490 [Pyrinomonadaceae bacterium MAG19_C2-C3]|nr:hypothetical protein [Pyrinomonadaceae bacterium MAG19_C2-C3]